VSVSIPIASISHSGRQKIMNMMFRLTRVVIKQQQDYPLSAAPSWRDASHRINEWTSVSHDPGEPQQNQKHCGSPPRKKNCVMANSSANKIPSFKLTYTITNTIPAIKNPAWESSTFQRRDNSDCACWVYLSRANRVRNQVIRIHCFSLFRSLKHPTKKIFLVLGWSHRFLWYI